MQSCIFWPKLGSADRLFGWVQQPGWFGGYATGENVRRAGNFSRPQLRNGWQRGTTEAAEHETAGDRKPKATLASMPCLAGVASCGDLAGRPLGCLRTAARALGGCWGRPGAHRGPETAVPQGVPTAVRPANCDDRPECRRSARTSTLQNDCEAIAGSGWLQRG